MKLLRCAVVLMLAAACQLSVGQSSGQGRTWSAFEDERASKCTVEVKALSTKPSISPSENMTIQCDASKSLSYETDDDLIDISLNYPHTDRILARWQGGSHVPSTVIDVRRSKVVFDELVEDAPDVINTPDVILVYRGKRWSDLDKAMIPTETDTYEWTGAEYLERLRLFGPRIYGLKIGSVFWR